MSRSRIDRAIVTVYATFGSDEEARRIARTLVEERLAACANILAPCHSIYRWQGKIEEAAEVPALFKTRAGRRDAADRAARRAAQLRRAGGGGLADRRGGRRLCRLGGAKRSG